jgi:hypothetical protein
LASVVAQVTYFLHCLKAVLMAIVYCGAKATFTVCYPGRDTAGQGPAGHPYVYKIQFSYQYQSILLKHFAGLNNFFHYIEVSSIEICNIVLEL